MPVAIEIVPYCGYIESDLNYTTDKNLQGASISADGKTVVVAEEDVEGDQGAVILVTYRWYGETNQFESITDGDYTATEIPLQLGGDNGSPLSNVDEIGHFIGKTPLNCSGDFLAYVYPWVVSLPGEDTLLAIPFMEFINLDPDDPDTWQPADRPVITYRGTAGDFYFISSADRQVGIAMSADSLTVAISISFLNRVVIFDYQAMGDSWTAPIEISDTLGPSNTLTLSQDGLILVYTTATGIAVKMRENKGTTWVTVGAPVLTAYTPIMDVALRPDGSMLYVKGNSSSIFKFPLDTSVTAGNLPVNGYTTPGPSIPFFASQLSANNLPLTASNDGTVLITVPDNAIGAFRTRIFFFNDLCSVIGSLPAGVCDVTPIVTHAGGVGVNAPPMAGGMVTTDNFRFGASVAFSGDGKELMIGATGGDHNALGLGRVYVYSYGGSSYGMRLKQELVGRRYVNPLGETDDNGFGSSISINFDGTIMAIGAPLTDMNGANSGLVHTYVLSGTKWIESSIVTAGAVVSGDNFGCSVALNAAGDSLAVGAMYTNATGASNAGAVYIFYLGAGGEWLYRNVIYPEFPKDNGYFGSAVVWKPSETNILTIGAMGMPTQVTGIYQSTNGGANAGAGVIYDYLIGLTQSTKTSQVFVLSNALSKDDNFGGAIAYDPTGFRLVVGAERDDTAQHDAGIVYFRGGEPGNSGYGLGDAGGNNGTEDFIDPNLGNGGFLDSQIWEVDNSANGPSAVGARWGTSLKITDTGSTAIVSIPGAALLTDRVVRVADWSVGNNGWSTRSRLPSPTNSAYPWGECTAITADGATIALYQQGLEIIYTYDWDDTQWILRVESRPNLSFNIRNMVGFTLNAIGDVLVVAVDGNDGTDNIAELLHYNWDALSRTWVEQDGSIIMTDSDIDFGSDMSMSSDGLSLAVGARRGGDDGQGIVYIFNYNTTTELWGSTAVLTDLNGLEDDHFGTSVCLSPDGTRIAIGCTQYGGNNLGRIYHYHRAPNTNSWFLRLPTFTVDDAPTNARVGYSVAITDHTVFDTTPGPLGELDEPYGTVMYTTLNPDESGTITFLGATLTEDGGSAISPFINGGDVAERTGLALPQASLLPTTPEAGSSWGQAIALSQSGAIAVIGAPTGNNGVGAVFVFDWSTVSGGWVDRGSIGNPVSTYGDHFGAGVSISGDGSVLAIGAPAFKGTNLRDGAVYVYDWRGTAWNRRVSPTLDLVTYPQIGQFGIEDAEFGASVSLSNNGTRLVVGAPGVNTGDGRVYSFEWDIPNFEWIFRPMVSHQGEHRFGASVGLSGDGLVLAVGAPDESGQGRVYVYDWFPTTSSWIERLSFTYVNVQTDDQFGISLTISEVGDIITVGSIVTGDAYVYDWNGSAWLLRLVNTI